MAHREALESVSQRSRSNVRFSVRWRPWITRSITSTPRVLPMRHGVHFPQDSMAQNSMA